MRKRLSGGAFEHTFFTSTFWGIVRRKDWEDGCGCGGGTAKDPLLPMISRSSFWIRKHSLLGEGGGKCKRRNDGGRQRDCGVGVCLQMHPGARCLGAVLSHRARIYCVPYLSPSYRVAKPCIPLSALRG